MNFKEIIKKYFKRNRKYFSSKNTLHRMNGVVLVRVGDAIFALNGLVTDEVVKYCKKQGYDIEKVVFINGYDIDLREGTKKISAKSSSEICIIEEDGKYVGAVVVSAYLEVE